MLIVGSSLSSSPLTELTNYRNNNISVSLPSRILQKKKKFLPLRNNIIYLHLFHSNDRKRKIFLSFKPPFFKSLQLTTDNSIMYDNLKRSTVSVLTPHKCLAKAFTNRKKKNQIYISLRILILNQNYKVLSDWR